MKKSALLFLFSFIFLCFAIAQTKKIANASHSGNQKEMKIDGDGNFGLSPIMIQQMHHYSDSVRKADSVKSAKRKMDSIHFADSLNKAKQMQAPKKSPGKKKGKGLHAAAEIARPTKTIANSMH